VIKIIRSQFTLNEKESSYGIIIHSSEEEKTQKEVTELREKHTFR